MVRVCGKLGSRVCGLLGSVCGSVGLAVLVVALAAVATRHAYAEDPVPVTLTCQCDPNDQACLSACVSVCNVSCDNRVPPYCSGGSCDAPIPGCEVYRCKPTYYGQSCECNAFRD
jgi:hypothetical protein